MGSWKQYAMEHTLTYDRNGYRIEAHICPLYSDKYATRVVIRYRGVTYVVMFESLFEPASKVVESIAAYAEDCRVIPVISYQPYSVRYVPRAFPGTDLHVEILVDAPARNNSRVSAFTAVSPSALTNNFEVLNEVENFAVLLFRIVGET